MLHRIQWQPLPKKGQWLQNPPGRIFKFLRTDRSHLRNLCLYMNVNKKSEGFSYDDQQQSVIMYDGFVDNGFNLQCDLSSYDAQQKSDPMVVSTKPTSSRRVIKGMGIHEFESEMAKLFGLQYETMTLEAFVNMISKDVLRKRIMMLEEQLTTFKHDRVLNICGRNIYLIEKKVIPRKSKTLIKYRVYDNILAYCIYFVANLIPNELHFLRSIRKNLQVSDSYGCPMIVYDECPTEGGTTMRRSDVTCNYYITDAGINLNGIRGVDNPREIMILCLISLFVTLPFVHFDCHLGNICISNTNIRYTYIWTIKIGTKVYELTWIAYGLVTVIDWNTSDVSSTRRKETDSFFIPHSIYTSGFQMFYPGGEIGIILLLGKLFTLVDPKFFEIRCMETSTSGSNCNDSTFSSILEVVPCATSDNSILEDEAFKRRLNTKFNRCGLAILQGKLKEQVFEELHKYIDELNITPYFNVPSDTGFVALRQDSCLVALTNISTGTKVTAVPYTSVKNLIHVGRQIFTNFQGTFVALKKFIPFAGMGFFAHEITKADEANCRINFKSGEFFLEAIKDIKVFDKIVVQKSSLSVTGVFHVIDNKADIIKEIVTEVRSLESMQRRSSQ